MRLETTETRFPVYIDFYELFFFWEIDEVYVFLIAAFPFVPGRKLLWGVAFGYIVMKLYKKRYKDKYYQNYIVHLLWMWGIYSPRRARKGHITRYRE